VQQIGTALEIYRRPHNRFVADFIGRANFLPVRVLDRASSMWVLELLGQVIEAPGEEDAAIRKSGQAVLMIRPESIRLSPTPPNNEKAAWSGVVTRTSYLGSFIEYDVEIADQKLLAVRYDPAESDLYPVHQAVYVQFLPENAYLLPGE